eukprot:scaffold4993_cov211-Prasinococcus_capsulatus_cf.AAC.7
MPAASTTEVRSRETNARAGGARGLASGTSLSRPVHPWRWGKRRTPTLRLVCGRLTKAPPQEVLLPQGQVY